jgi:periplasmic protein CpxP/Spy
MIRRMVRAPRSWLAIILTAGMASTAMIAPPLVAQSVDRQPARTSVPAQQRPALERQFRERLAEIVRRRLDLNDGQMRKLGQVNDRFERDRMLLLREERQVRQSLRREVLARDSADQSKVSGLLDQALRIQRQRLDLTEREQRELAAFMTPVQRAMYFGIQDDLRRRMEELRQERQERPRRGASMGAARRPSP